MLHTKRGTVKNSQGPPSGLPLGSVDQLLIATPLRPRHPRLLVYVTTHALATDEFIPPNRTHLEHLSMVLANRAEAAAMVESESRYARESATSCKGGYWMTSFFGYRLLRVYRFIRPKRIPEVPPRDESFRGACT